MITINNKTKFRLNFKNKLNNKENELNEIYNNKENNKNELYITILNN